MKIIKQKVFKVEYKTKYNSDLYELVEADSFEEAIKISTEYHKNNQDVDFQIKGIYIYINVLKPISKSVTKTITVEL